MEILFFKTPNLSHLHVFGCLCYGHTRTYDKFHPYSRRFVFLGYPSGKKEWYRYDIDTQFFCLPGHSFL